MQDSIFTRIIKGEIPSYKVYEDDRFYAFLDIRPVQKGHTLLIPKKQEDYLFDLEDALLADMILCAKRLALAIREAYPCKKVGMAVMGMEVDHAHIHLVPINSDGDMHFAQAKKEFTPEEMATIAEKIAACVR